MVASKISHPDQLLTVRSSLWLLKVKVIHGSTSTTMSRSLLKLSVTESLEYRVYHSSSPLTKNIFSLTLRNSTSVFLFRDRRLSSLVNYVSHHWSFLPLSIPVDSFRNFVLLLNPSTIFDVFLQRHFISSNPLVFLYKFPMEEKEKKGPGPGTFPRIRI